MFDQNLKEACGLLKFNSIDKDFLKVALYIGLTQQF